MSSEINIDRFNRVRKYLRISVFGRIRENYFENSPRIYHFVRTEDR